MWAPSTNLSESAGSNQRTKAKKKLEEHVPCQCCHTAPTKITSTCVQPWSNLKNHMSNKEEHITTKIQDDQDIAIPSGNPPGYPTRSQPPNNAWSREMVYHASCQVYQASCHWHDRQCLEQRNGHEHSNRQQERAAEFAEDVAAIMRSNQLHQKEELSQANKAAITARSRSARAILKPAMKN